MPLKKKWSEAQNGKKGWKADYFEKLLTAMRTYSKFLLVNADNVSSKQFAEIRQAMRGQCLIVMGKNTMMKKCIRMNMDEFPEYERILPLLVGNVGFVFTNNDLVAMRDKIAAFKTQAPARQGQLSDCDVVVPAQHTAFGPEQTAFFQSLSIATKINRGTIEIVSPVNLLSKGQVVGASEATLLNMLSISPFFYGLKPQHCYDQGSVFETAVLDITPEDIRAKFMQGVTNIASVSLNIGYPTLASVPHSMANAFKRLVAISLGTEVTFPEAEKIKDRLANPDAYAVVAPVGDSKPAEEAQPEEEEEEEDQESSDFGGGMFDQASSSSEESSDESSD